MVRNLESDSIARDDQIEYLESQVEAYKARSSILQQQQISALDALDNVVQQHKQQCEEEAIAKRHLEHRLRKSGDMFKEVERDRDELRDAVLELIEKVEKTNHNFTLWPYTKLQLSSHADPYALTEPTQTVSALPSKVQELREHLAYANGIILALKNELSLEQQAHALTRSRVHSLEAQIANRDTALQTWIQCAGNSTPVDLSNQYQNGKAKRAGKGKGPERQRDLNRAEISSVFLQTLANNRVLEQEVRNLFSNVEKARARAEEPILRSLSPSPPKPSSATLQPNSDMLIPISSLPDRGRTKEWKGSHQYLQYRTHSSPSLPQLQSSVGLSFLPSTEPIAGPSKIVSLPRTPSPRSKSSYAPELAPLHTRERASIKKPQIQSSPRRQHRFRTPSRSRTTEPPPSGDLPPNNVLQHLDEQIHLLSVQIDAFRAERIALLHIIDTQLRSGGETSKAFDERSQDNRGHDVEASNAGLGLESASHVEVQHAVTNEDGIDAGDGTDDGERSMDLATPLFSTLMALPVTDSLFEEYLPASSHSVPAASSSRSHSPTHYSAPRVDVMEEPGLGVTNLQIGQSEHNDAEVASPDGNDIRMIRPRISVSTTSPPP